MGVYLKSTDNRPDDHCCWCDPENISVLVKRTPVQALLQVEGPAGRDLGEGQGGDEEGEAEVAWETYWPHSYPH